MNNSHIIIDSKGEKNIDYNDEILKFYTLFDDCISEMFQLMYRSFVQFLNTQVTCIPYV